jgi:hypothetical protein
MARKRCNGEDILRLLREIEVHLHGGMDVVSVHPIGPDGRRIKKTGNTGSVLATCWTSCILKPKLDQNFVSRALLVLTLF